MSLELLAAHARSLWVFAATAQLAVSRARYHFGGSRVEGAGIAGWAPDQVGLLARREFELVRHTYQVN